MNQSSRDDYLKAEVLTASPQKLQLMMIQAAIRNVRQGLEALQRGERELTNERLLKAQDIIGQILTGLRSEHDPELVGKVAAIYVYLLRTLVEGMLESDAKRLIDVLRILEEERETWTQLCEQLGKSTATKSTLSGPHRQQVLNSLPKATPALAKEEYDGPPPSDRFNLEA